MSDDEFTIGIVAPISDSTDINKLYTEDHWSEVLSIVQECYSEDDNSIELVSDSVSSSVIISEIVQNLATKSLIICDVSSKNSNVMFELGLRLAFDKPIILIIDSITDYSFDISPIKHILYPVTLAYTAVKSFQNELSRAIEIEKNKSDSHNSDSYLSHFKVQNVAKTLPEEKIDEIQSIHSELTNLSKAVRNLVSRNVKFSATLPTRIELKKYIDSTSPGIYTPDDIMISNVRNYFNLESLDDDAIIKLITSTLVQLKEANDLPF